MSTIFILKKEPPKKPQIFIFLKDYYFVIGGPIDMNVGVSWETSAGFVISGSFVTFPKI